jgi:hypothetical protein
VDIRLGLKSVGLVAGVGCSPDEFVGGLLGFGDEDWRGVVEAGRGEVADEAVGHGRVLFLVGVPDRSVGVAAPCGPGMVVR